MPTKCATYSSNELYCVFERIFPWIPSLIVCNLVISVAVYSCILCELTLPSYNVANSTAWANSAKSYITSLSVDTLPINSWSTNCVKNFIAASSSFILPKSIEIACFKDPPVSNGESMFISAVPKCAIIATNLSDFEGDESELVMIPSSVEARIWFLIVLSKFSLS